MSGGRPMVVALSDREGMGGGSAWRQMAMILETPYIPEVMRVMDDHPISGFVRRELNDPDAFLIYFAPTSKYGIARWLVKPPNDWACLRELISVGDSPDDFTQEKAHQLRRRCSAVVQRKFRDMLRQVQSWDRGYNRKRDEQQVEDAEIRARDARDFRINTPHPLWRKKAPVTVSLAAAGGQN